MVKFNRHSLTLALATARVYFINLYIEFRYRRLENKKRRWTAYRTNGGNVPLGRLNKADAIDKVGKFGTILYVDLEIAGIFFRDKY